MASFRTSRARQQELTKQTAGEAHGACAPHVNEEIRATDNAMHTIETCVTGEVRKCKAGGIDCTCDVRGAQHEPLDPRKHEAQTHTHKVTQSQERRQNARQPTHPAAFFFLSPVGSRALGWRWCCVGCCSCCKRCSTARRRFAAVRRNAGAPACFFSLFATRN